MKIACIDDAPDDGNAILNLTTEVLSRYAVSVSRADCYTSANHFFRQWHPGMYRMIFLDIFLGDENGINAARTIRRADPSVLLVFCSSSNEFATESYEVQANYYLVKPVSQSKAVQMVHRLKLLNAEEDMLELPDHRMLLLSGFLYSDYHNHQITVTMKKGAPIRIWSSEADFLRLLEPFHYFLAVNPGTIINLKEVAAMEDDVFRMSDGSTVPMSRRKKKELEQAYKNYLFAELRKGS